MPQRQDQQGQYSRRIDGEVGKIARFAEAHVLRLHALSLSALSFQVTLKHPAHAGEAIGRDLRPRWPTSNVRNGSSPGILQRSIDVYSTRESGRRGGTAVMSVSCQEQTSRASARA